jgi:protein involved in polysaccharide export with SLBB domain
MKYKILIVLSFLFVGYQSFSQNVTEAAARAELQKRGYDESRFREELIKKGINIDVVDPNNPAQMAKAEQAVKEVMEILEKEKSANKAAPTSKQPEVSTQKPVEEQKRSSDQLAGNQSKEIQKAVKQGATLEEAVAEKFQESVKDKTPDPITYGQHVFRDKSMSIFRSAEDSKPSKAYVLGSGDKIAVSIWGPTQENFAEEITRDGYIQPTGLPRIYLSGLTVDGAEKLLASKLSTKYYFQKENFDVTVTTARTVNVNIVGEVFQSGTFNISAVNNAFNALVAAGGPNNIGSVRNIQIKRPGSKKDLYLDVYKYLQDPIISQEFYLLENDFIYVPVAEKLVNISGAVNRSFRYELLNNEHLNELIKFAGGLKANALKGNIKVTRVENDTVRIIDVNLYELEKNKSNFSLKNGDYIEVLTIGEQIRNEVNISGAVENPGRYSLNDNPRISDLLKKAILNDNAITSIAYLKRYNQDQKTIRYEFVNLGNVISNPASSDNFALQRNDELIVSSQASFKDKFEVTVEGAVRDPKKMPLDYSKNLKVSDAVFFAGGLRPEAMDFAYIFRPKPDDISVIDYIYVDIRQAIENPNSTANISLEPRDRVVVYDKSSYYDKSVVNISGAVRKGGEFQFNPNLTLKDLILLAGGLRSDAALDRIDVFRLSYEDGKSIRTLAANIKLNPDLVIQNNGGSFELKPFDQIFIRTLPEYELQRNVYIQGEVKYPGTYALIGDNTKLATIIKESGGVTKEAFLEGATLKRSEKDKEGFIIIDLQKALASPKSFENIILQQGDVISIPKINNTVTLSGAVKSFEFNSAEQYTQGKLMAPYQKGTTAKYYIEKYGGGLAKNADRHNIIVIDANGKVSKTKSFLGIKGYPKVGPGSNIKVGTKEPKPEKESDKEDVKWGDVLANSVAQATTILSLILLIQNVN